MGWKQYARQIQAANKRAERSASKRHRDLVKQYEKAERLASAASEVALFESYLESLVSVHKGGGETWDWERIKSSPAPSPPSRVRGREAAAQSALSAFKPTLIQRLFGGEARIRLPLEEALKKGAAEDSHEYEQAADKHREAHARWTTEVPLADGVLRRDLDSYRAAVQHTGVADELAAFKTKVTFEAVETDVIALNCVLEDDEIVPTEELKLTAAGKVSTKAMAAGRYWAYYQDHVCSCALRLAREAFAVLPVSRVIVNVQTFQVDPSTGHLAIFTILGINFVRGIFDRLNLVNLDPSDSMKNFPHRMKFKKTAGFEPVEPVTLDEQWVNT